MSNIHDIVYLSMFALVGIVLLCSFAIPLMSEYMGKLGDFYGAYVPVLGIVVSLLIIFLIVGVIPRHNQER